MSFIYKHIFKFIYYFNTTTLDLYIQMGNTLQTPQYGLFTSDTPKPNETRILRRPDLVNTSYLKSDPNNYGTILKAFEVQLLKHPDKNFLGTREYISPNKYGPYKWKSYSEIDTLSNYFLYAMAKLNLCPKIYNDMDKKYYKFFGIYCRNKVEWIVSDLACQKDSIAIVTIYDTLGLQAIEFIFQQTELQSLIMESVSLEKIILLAEKKKLSHVSNLIVVPCENDSNMNKNINKCKELGLNVYLYNDLLEIGKQYFESKPNISFEKATPDTLLTVCYTSGTSGNPKGAMIRQNSLVSAVSSIDTIGIDLNENDTYISFLPLAHIMERLIFLVNIYCGCSVGFYSGNINNLQDDLVQLKPTFFCTVPRVLDKLYEKIMGTIKKINNPFKKKLIAKGIETKLYNYKHYGILTHAVYDKLVFQHIKKNIGGRVRWVLVGSAPINGDLLQFLRIAFSCPITEGYGQTENSAGCLLAHVDDNTTGHLGGVDGCVELKLVDVPELNYKSDDVNPITGEPEPRGEICVRGASVFDGYYKDIEQTKNAIDEDGWLHSGDIGIMLLNHGNAIKIIDRKKNIFKLSQGEYIATEKVEKCLSTSKYVKQVCIYGDGLKSFIVAIIVPNKEEVHKFLKETCKEQVEESNVEKFYKDKRVVSEILRDFGEIKKNFDLKGFEVPKNIYLTPEEFTINNNLLTPTLKIKIAEVHKKYKQEINNMYNNNINE